MRNNIDVREWFKDLNKVQEKESPKSKANGVKLFESALRQGFVWKGGRFVKL